MFTVELSKKTGTTVLERKKNSAQDALQLLASHFTCHTYTKPTTVTVTHPICDNVKDKGTSFL